MEKLVCRLLPYEVADGPNNMAIDEELFHAAETGEAALRFYGWSPTTLSLGLFQTEKIRQTDPLLAALPYVRRNSGGDALVHHHEVTYALALPPGQWQQGTAWSIRMHRIIADALADFGVIATLQRPKTDKKAVQPPSSVLCFHNLTEGDVLVGKNKVVGSAQRKNRGAIVQHGAILLAKSPHAPSLPGIRELSGQVLNTIEVCQGVLSKFIESTAAKLVEKPLTPEERQRAKTLAGSKFGNPTWNCKR